MSTRVVIVLKGGNFVPCDFQSQDAASRFIKKWNDDKKNGVRSDMIYGVATDGQLHWSVLAKQIAGMYIQGETTADRVASAVEKIASDATQGDDWKG